MDHVLYIDEDFETAFGVIQKVQGNQITVKDVFDYKGEVIDGDVKIISYEKILTWRPRKYFNVPIFIRHYTSRNNNSPKASMFIKKGDRIEGPSNGLGSGIYGIYIKDEEHAQLIQNRASQYNKNIQFFDCECLNPFVIEDKYHLKSITAAANSTARFINRIISDSVNLNDKIDEIVNLTNLWNTVFFRHGMWPMTTRILFDILYNYIQYIHNNDSIIDMKGNVTHELPMNFIFKYLGYKSLISDDDTINDFQNGCLILNYTSYTTLIESKGASRLNIA